MGSLGDQIRYDPSTGLFHWKKIGHGRVQDKPCGTYSNLGYSQICVDRKRYLGHRLAWYLTYGEFANYKVTKNV